MRKIFILIISVLTINTAFAQSFGTTAEIINSDCRIQFNNTNGVKIFELIGENLTWWRQSNNSIVIRDKVTQVTIASNYSGTPAFAALDDSLDAWILACKDCCSGGGSDTIILDGNAFIVQGQNSAIQVDNTVDFDGDEIKFTGISTNDTSSGLNILIGVASGIAPEEIALASVANDSGRVNIAGIVIDGFPQLLFEVITNDIDYGVFFTKEGLLMGGAAVPDTLIHLNSDVATALSLTKQGTLSHSGAYANTSIEINNTAAGFTISDNVSIAIYNPATTQATATITLPPNPSDGQMLNISFGGSVTSGTVVTSLTISPNSGQTVLIGNAGTTGTVENPITLIYIGGISQWRLVGN